MRLFKNVLLPAFMLVMLVAMPLVGSVTANEPPTQATPVTDEQTPTATSNQHSPNGLQIQERPTVTLEYDDPDIVDPQVGDIYTLKVMATFSNPNANDQLNAVFTWDGGYQFRRMGVEEGYGEITFRMSLTDQVVDACETEGRVSSTIEVFGELGDEYYNAFESRSVNCRFTHEPVQPDINLIVQTELCGPNNDTITFAQTGVSYSLEGWSDNQNTIHFAPAEGFTLAHGAVTSHTLSDTEECGATASFTGPTSLYLLEPGSQMTITGTYDVSSLWPQEGSLSARIEGAFVTDRIGRYFGVLLPISSPADSFSVTSTLPDEWLADLCTDPDYAGNLVVNFDIIFYQQTGESSTETVWVYEHTFDIPCTVALTPLEASINNDVCGYIDERVIVPTQAGITGHTITWANNVATISYQTIAGYEVGGGPYTVTVTADPCITEPVPDPGYSKVCGIENDEIRLGASIDGVLYETSEVWIDGVYTIWVSALPGWELPADTQTKWEFVDPGNCEIEGLTAPIHTEVCGENNDTVQLPEEMDHVTIATTGDMATDGTVTVTLTPHEHYALPDGIDAEYTFTDAGDCMVTPVPPEALVAVCGPNNDILTIPTQPDGVTIDDSGWVDNKRTLTLGTADGYVFPENTPRTLTSVDENIACEEDPVGTTLVVIFETSDGQSIEGAPYSLYAPVASQTMQEPFIEGEIGPSNQIVFQELRAGTYRLVTSPEGYEPIDETFGVAADEASEEHIIAIAALQPVVTPTPEPTVEPTVEPTLVPTLEPTVGSDPAPTEETSQVSGLPSTGSGSGSDFGVFALVGLLTATMLAVLGSRRRT